MTVALSPNWSLSDTHTAASYGHPVLVNQQGDTFGPTDLVLYPGREPIAAKLAVVHLARTAGLNAAECHMVDRFTQ